MIDLKPKSNIANKVRNTRLPRTKPLMPLFEVISNSIHAINEAKKSNQLTKDGKIEIKLIRNGDDKTLSELKEIDNYPIKSILVKDNGIGLNDENLVYFTETDTDHKLDIGGKGVGRFVCLKAFKQLTLKSNFSRNGSIIYREFEFRNTKEGFHNPNEYEVKNKSIGTEVLLSDFKIEYQKKAPKDLIEIAREVVTHFQLYFIRNEAPIIIIKNQNNVEVNLSKLFNSEFKKDIKTKPFVVGENSFSLFLTKASNAMSHKLHFCAHNRSVKEEGLYNRLVDLGKYSVKDDNESFYYQAYVVGDILDQYVDIERVGFNFPDEEDGEDDSTEISLSKIRNGAIEGIEEILAEYLNKVRNEKVEKYRPLINEEFPQYMSTFTIKSEEIKKLPPNLTKSKLDIELYKIESTWKLEVKELGQKLIDEKKDITNLDEYKEKYEKFLTEFNEIGKADLARYIVHRKSVIELLEDLLGKNANDKFSNEDIIHSVFFPIRTSSDEVPHSKQNLWLIDERLTYHSFLASDKSFESIKELDIQDDTRPDLLIFNDAIAFTEDEYPPFNSFTIVEFKKPQRDNYIDNDPKKNPLDQVEKYIEQLLEGKVENRRGRKIKLDEKTPFYVYIICDITDSFERILKNREFSKTPDGDGYFKFKDKYYSAYIEVIPFEKVLKDAKKRNRILFDKLGLSAGKDKTLFD
ncbi:ATP-binding protein [Maribellus comscasis]|uniref:ATP-binding protein n=1 Tax=Maribellus comscasis TaxID=2681766 RepID=A0A6I6K8A4_9BACT|nr:ATP-binding protein [Maribellus comscasis]QGY47863.1 ATP-binding protein [Maribellus comscasis]